MVRRIFMVIVRPLTRFYKSYKVISWSITFDSKIGNWNYDIDFRRLQTEADMSAVLRRPYEDEVDDYKEYKRLRQLARADHGHLHRAGPLRESELERPSDQTLSNVDNVSTMGDLVISSPKIRPSLPHRPRSSPPGSPRNGPSDRQVRHSGRKSFQEERKTRRVGSIEVDEQTQKYLESMRKKSVDLVGSFTWQ